MTDPLVLHSFGVNDRSGKLRWLCHELEIPLEEARVKPGDHYKAPYTELNPYKMIPAAQWRGETLIESTASSTYIAEQFPEAGVVVAPGEPDRRAYLTWVALFAETFESRLVEYLLSSYEWIDAAFQTTTKATVKHRLPVLLEHLPAEGFLVGDRFTLADIEAAYSLRLAIAAKLLTIDDVGGYLRPLMARPAAKRAEFFSSIEA